MIRLDIEHVKVKMGLNVIGRLPISGIGLKRFYSNWEAKMISKLWKKLLMRVPESTKISIHCFLRCPEYFYGQLKTQVVQVLEENPMIAEVQPIISPIRVLTETFAMVTTNYSICGVILRKQLLQGIN